MYKVTCGSEKYTDFSNEYDSSPAVKQMDLTANNHITELEEKKLKYFFTNVDISDQCNCKQRHEKK